MDNESEEQGFRSLNILNPAFPSLDDTLDELISSNDETSAYTEKVGTVRIFVYIDERKRAYRMTVINFQS